MAYSLKIEVHRLEIVRLWLVALECASLKFVGLGRVDVLIQAYEVSICKRSLAVRFHFYAKALLDAYDH